MNWSIAPGEGLGPLRLGMTRPEVEALPHMGKPQHLYRGAGGRQMEYRGLGVPICEYADGTLQRIVASRHVEGVRFDGLDVFGTEPQGLVRAMEALLGKVTLCQEQLCFPEAGVILSGFYEPHDRRFFQPDIEHHDERSITLYAPGGCAGTCDIAEPLSFT